MQYRDNETDQEAWESALRPTLCLLATHSKLQEIVASKPILAWSSQQISGWLKQHPDDESLRVSHVSRWNKLSEEFNAKNERFSRCIERD